MACEVLAGLGLEPDLRLSDPGILRAVLAKAGFAVAEQLALFDRILDGDLTALDEVQDGLPELPASLRSLLASEGEGVPYLNNLRAALLSTVPELERPLDELTLVAQVLDESDRSYRISPALVRNFEYYTGPVFHFLVGDRKVGGGGRYDSLVSLIGGPNVPASGLALDVEALMAALPSLEARPPARVSIRAGGSASTDLAAAFQLARALRDRGWSVELAGPAGDSQPWQVVASAGSFAVTGNGSKDRRFSAVEEVVEALAEARRD
jgi:histidyl-tRNA synthetase